MNLTWRINRFPILESTNDLALAWMRGNLAQAGDVLVAAEQTGGRGRPGRTWHSPRGSLLCTAVLPFYPERVGWTALAAGVAVAQALSDLGAPAGVKWPNDVVMHGRKMAGVLVETNSTGLVAVGIGLNVCNPLPPDPELASRAARLDDHLPGVGVEDVLHSVLRRLAGCWELLAQTDLGPLRRLWNQYDTTAGRTLRWSQEGVIGVAEGIEDSGALRLRTSDGRRVIAAVGEVAFLDHTPNTVTREMAIGVA